jgi:hypothetical protein
MFYHLVENIEEASEQNALENYKFDLENAIAELSQLIIRMTLGQRSPLSVSGKIRGQKISRRGQTSKRYQLLIVSGLPPSSPASRNDGASAVLMRISAVEKMRRTA